MYSGSSWHFSVRGFAFTFPTFVLLGLGVYEAGKLIVGLVS